MVQKLICIRNGRWSFFVLPFTDWIHACFQSHAKCQSELESRLACSFKWRTFQCSVHQPSALDRKMKVKSINCLFFLQQINFFQWMISRSFIIYRPHALFSLSIEATIYGSTYKRDIVSTIWICYIPYGLHCYLQPPRCVKRKKKLPNN